ncbi:Mannose-6-phosphate isomerase [Kingella kingae]|nr:hypothetical protein GB851_04115 [Kingella kingae]CRZ20800.1 Mannose-6-phosphate isomerase [Kingella kingae]
MTSQSLFLQSTFHDKIWGGNAMRRVFGYDIPSETTGEY